MTHENCDLFCDGNGALSPVVGAHLRDGAEQALASDDACDGDSLSLRHNSNGQGNDEAAKPHQKLNGSHRKTGYCLDYNVREMGRKATVERMAFLTITVGEYTADERGRKGRRFQQVHDHAEASRRINSLATRVLNSLFVRWIIVTERHKSGAIHFHLVCETRGDVRGSFDFESFLEARSARASGARNRSAERRAWMSATPWLREAWRLLRAKLPAYGFGRAELTPVAKSAEAIGHYVGKYVAKNIKDRRAEDVGKKLVRYGGWKGRQLKPNDFCWCTESACEWRRRAETLAACIDCRSPSEAAAACGPRWAFHFGGVMEVGEKSAFLPLSEFLEAMKGCMRRLIVSDRWMEDREWHLRWENFEAIPEATVEVIEEVSTAMLFGWN